MQMFLFLWKCVFFGKQESANSKMNKQNVKFALCKNIYNPWVLLSMRHKNTTCDSESH